MNKTTYKKKNIVNLLKSAFKNKPKGHHDPLFLGNEKKYLQECISSSYVSYVGKFVNLFEKKISFYTKSKFAIATSSGTSALHLVLNYFKVNSNDEVLLPSLTYIATANPIVYCGATPNFLDIENETLGICPKKLENYLKKITIKIGPYVFNKKTKKRIKALIAVHLYGFPCKILEIKKICEKYRIILIEDAAEAIGSFFLNKHLGTFGDAGILSFNGNKTITCGSGGAILINNKKASLKLKHLSTHAKKPNIFDHIHDDIGYNYRMSNLSAAVGCAQIENIKNIIKAKRKNFVWYKKIFNNVSYLKILEEPRFSKSNYWLITIVLKDKKLKNILIRNLKKYKFGIRTPWRPLHSLKIFKNCPRDSMNNSNDFFGRALNLPSSPKINYK